MQTSIGSSRLIAAEKAYAAAEMDRLKLVIERNRMNKGDFARALSAAWCRSADALEYLTVIRQAEAVSRLEEAAIATQGA